MQPVRTLGKLYTGLVNVTRQVAVTPQLALVRSFSVLRKLPCGCNVGQCACRAQLSRSEQQKKPCGCKGKCVCKAD
jgi:hypothetical protein